MTVLEDIRTLCKDITQCNTRIQNVLYSQDVLFVTYNNINFDEFIRTCEDIAKELNKIGTRFDSLSAMFIGINDNADNLDNHNMLNMLDSRMRALGENLAAAMHYNDIILELK